MSAKRFIFLSAFLAIFSPSNATENFVLPSEISSSQYAKEMTVAYQLALDAGKVLREIQHSDQDLQIQQKEGFMQVLSPVTIADMRANQIICHGLNKQFPDYGILTEEEVDDPSLQNAIRNWRSSELTWIIDPLDGTNNFIKKGKDYGIHIGLTLNGEPVLGLNYYPELNTAYFAVKGHGAFKQEGSKPPQQLFTSPFTGQIHPIRNTDPQETAAIYEKLLGYEITPQVLQQVFSTIDSCGLRICSIAEGWNNLYASKGLRGGLWDYCSGEVIIREAGGTISDLNGNPIDYRSENARINHGAIVSSDKELHDRALQAISAQF